MASGITTYPHLSPLRRLPHSPGTPPHHHTYTEARAYRRRRRWCRSSCRSASPRASSNVAKAKCGLTRMKLVRYPWRTPVRLIRFPLLINCSLGWGCMDLWVRYLSASFGNRDSSIRRNMFDVRCGFWNSCLGLLVQFMGMVKGGWIV